MRFACWITKTIHTHSEYIILLLFHSNNGFANAPQCYAMPVLFLNSIDEVILILPARRQFVACRMRDRVVVILFGQLIHPIWGRVTGEVSNAKHIRTTHTQKTNLNHQARSMWYSRQELRQACLRVQGVSNSCTCFSMRQVILVVAVSGGSALSW